MNARKLLAGVLLLAGGAVFFVLDLGGYFSLAYLQEQHSLLAACRTQEFKNQSKLAAV